MSANSFTVVALKCGGKKYSAVLNKFEFNSGEFFYELLIIKNPEIWHVVFIYIPPTPVKFSAPYG